EGEVVERLGVSRTPVRSALQRLQQEGYIQATLSGRQSRLVVTPLTQEDVDELFGLVGELEGLAARRAARLERSARSALVRKLREHNGGLRANAGAVSPDPDRWLDFDFAFHGAYVAAAGGPRLRALHAGIIPQAERYARVYVSSLTNRILESAAEHDGIVRAIESGDGDLAQRATQLNWRNAAERLSSIVARIGELGTW
ncbi:MAG TPA: GntR family transcriptional regulator, partial [Longimicrobiales bacterium]